MEGGGGDYMGLTVLGMTPFVNHTVHKLNSKGGGGLLHLALEGQSPYPKLGDCNNRPPPPPPPPPPPTRRGRGGKKSAFFSLV